MNNTPPKFSYFFEVFSNMPRGQLIFLSLAGVTWLIGGNILIAFHYKRIGKPWYSGLKPFAFPFRKFNLKEWLTLFGLVVLTFTFGIIGIYWPIPD